MQVRRIVLGVAAAAALSLLCGAAAGQDAAPLPPVHLHPAPDSSTTPAPAPDQATTPAPIADQTPAAQAPSVQAPVAQAPAAQSPTAQAPKPAPAKKGKKEKEVYTGPTEIIVKDPTPMLDEEGKQRVDTEGKPMFNPGIKQQRDKKGHPLFDEAGKPVFQTAKELGYDEKGKKITAAKVKPPKMTPMSISRGTFTVDGVIGKAELNYEIADLKYIYLYVPGMGITLVSNVPFPGAKEQKNAFNEKTLTVMVNDHKLEIGSDKRLLAKKPVSAFVAVDPTFTLPSKYPVVGYGSITKSPYAWPGSKSNAELKGIVTPPPIPKNLEPVKLLTPCPTGQMRMPAPPVLPGQVAPNQPCVPIAQAQAALKKLKAQQAANAADAKASAAQPAAATPAPAPVAETPAPAPVPETPAPAPPQN